MSNTSYSFKENSHMKVIQGGEKKVMKKILSVALSTAMAFSMFASVAFGADTAKLTPAQQFEVLKEAGIVTGYPDGTAGLDKFITRAELAKVIVKSINLEPITGVATYKDKNYTASHWAAPFIEAATQAGILEGKDSVKKLFDPTGNVTVQELAKVLVAALKLEVPAETNNTATEWAKGYVEAAIKAGYLDAGMNYQANATRSQVIVAAHAIYEFNNFKVTKAEATDATHVKLTLSTGEVVDVVLEKALEANKATELTYKAADGRELKYTVTWVVTEATKIESVTADNLKQVVIKFDGKLDEASAKSVGNYNVGKDIKSASLSDDGTTVTLLLSGENFGQNSLTNQKEAKLTVDGVKSAQLTKTFSQDIKFTPVDVTTPTVKELVGLGTSAFQVVFSEPVDRATAISAVNYKIDGKAISGIVEYQYPNTVIVSTTMTTGAHKLTISNVKDFSDLKVLPLEHDFTVAEDTAAPEVVSAKSNDFKEVVIEFNEPIKSVSKAYNGISSKTATVDRSGKKVTLTFADPLTYSENNIVLEGVTDYSGNSGKVEVKVTPTPDAERPTVASVTSDIVGGSHEITVTYSKAVKNGTDKANYTLRDKDGKVVVGKGTDSNGHPIQAITTVNSKKYIIKLAGTLDAGNYTLDVAGVIDTAYVPNTILPYSAALKIADVAAPELKKVWVEKEATYNGKEDVYIYATFTKDFAIEGNGSALEKSKYNVSIADGKYEALPTNAYVDAISPNTVRITIPQATAGKYTSAATLNLRVTLVSDAEGHFGYANDGYVGDKYATAPGSNFITVATGEVKSVATNELTVKFEGTLTSINPSEFAVTTGLVESVAKSVKSYSHSGGNTTVTFTFADGAIPVDAEATATKFGFATGVNNTNTTTQDNYGIKVNLTPVQVLDRIAPEAVDYVTDGKKIDVVSVSGNTYKATVKFNEVITSVPGSAAVTLGVVGPKSIAVTLDSYTVATTGPNAGKALEVTFTVDRLLVSNDVITVGLVGNADSKVVKDAKGNAAANFSLGGAYGEVATAVAASGLTVTAAQGSVTGTTVITATPAVTGTNTLHITKSAASAVAPAYGSVAPGVAYTGTDFSVVAGEFVQVYEVNAAGQVVGYGQYEVQTADIKA